MDKGPIINNHKGRIVTRDPLGVLGVSQSIVGDICPIINSVTPNAFYWVFLNWIYYDYYVIRRLDLRTKITLDDYVRTLNFYVVLGNKLNNINYTNMLGSNYFSKNIKEDKNSYTYYPNYVKDLTVIYYYRGALTRANLISYIDKDDNPLDHILYLDKGIALGESLHKYLKDTKMYKEYILNNNYKDIPKDVIKEFANIASFDMKNLDEAKKLLRYDFFNEIPELKIQEKLIKHFYYDLDIKDIKEEKVRKYLFNYYSKRWDNNTPPEYLKKVMPGWEVLVNRHYFVAVLYMLFSYFVINLKTIDYKEYLNILTSDVDNVKLGDFLNNNKLRAEEIENILNTSDMNHINKDIVINCCKILSSIYYSLNNRLDLNNEYLEKDNYGTSISLKELLESIEIYKNKTLKEYALYILENYIIKQHQNTARRKYLSGEYNYYFVVENELIYKVNNTSDLIGLQSLRIEQTFQVMKTIGMLEE